MSRALLLYQQEIMKNYFQLYLPDVEFIRIEYLAFYDRFHMVLFMRTGQWHFECLLSKNDLNKPDMFEMLKPIFKELKDYLNPVWC